MDLTEWAVATSPIPGACQDGRTRRGPCGQKSHCAIVCDPDPRPAQNQCECSRREEAANFLGAEEGAGGF